MKIHVTKEWCEQSADIEGNPENLEGSGPTNEERRENAKAIDAMHPANRFRLMFGMPLLPENANVEARRK